MQELIYAVLGVAGLIIGIKVFDNYNISNNQKKLELSSRDFDKIEASLRGEQKQEDKETKQKVDEIEREKNNKPSNSSLADWFSRRK